MTHDEKVAHVRAVARTCRGALDPAAAAAISSALAQGDLERAALLDTLRVPCGADVNELILTQDLDGEPHRAECPSCGAEHTWTHVWAE